MSSSYPSITTRPHHHPITSLYRTSLRRRLAPQRPRRLAPRACFPYFRRRVRRRAIQTDKKGKADIRRPRMDPHSGGDKRVCDRVPDCQSGGKAQRIGAARTRVHAERTCGSGSASGSASGSGSASSSAGGGLRRVRGRFGGRHGISFVQVVHLKINTKYFLSTGTNVKQKKIYENEGLRRRARAGPLTPFLNLSS